VYNGVIIVDFNGKITYANDTAVSLLGITSFNVMDKNVISFLPNMGKKVIECLETQKSFEEISIIERGINILSNITPISMHGNIVGAVCVFFSLNETNSADISNNGKVKINDILDLIIDCSRDGLALIDSNGVMLRMNRADELLYDLCASDCIGRHVDDLVSQSYFDKSVSMEVLRRKCSVTLVQVTRRNRSLLVTGTPAFDGEGNVNFVITNSRDITDLENELRESQILEKIQRSQSSRSEFRTSRNAPFVYRSEVMQKVVETAIKASEVDSNVLIMGDSGVGKTILARFIHENSPRAGKRFQEVNCSAFPESLIESELFGYEKWAFTGANSRGKPGLFEIADGGTLFLDEICEISGPTQVKLLKFIEDNEVCIWVA
jgi:PAS domain S-box-containing protein